MIRGVVNARLEAVVWLRVRGLAGAESGVEAVIDTGFTAALALPSTTIAALGLIHQSGGQAVLADGSIGTFDVYGAEVASGAGWRPALVWAVGDETLVGLKFLAGHELRMEVVRGGVVEITLLPRRIGNLATES